MVHDMTRVIVLLTGVLSVSVKSLEETGDTTSLRLVHVLFRHGDRSPVKNYPKDPVKETDWPQGWGQLSQVGMHQAFFLGQILKEQYIDSNFLDEKYKRSQVFIRSTDKDRTLMSAYCVLAGLYPPNGTQMWNKNLTWQPVPVHTEPLSEDRLLYTDDPCPKFDKLIQTFWDTSNIVKKTARENRKFFEYVSNNTGVPATFDGIFSVLDTLFCENTAGKLPDFLWLKVNKTFDRLMALRDLHASWKCPTAESARLRAGQLVYTIKTNMEKKSKKDSEMTHKMILYSGHDSTVIYLLKALSIYNERQPPYSTSVVIELHEDEHSKFSVRFYFRNDTNSPNIHLHKLILPGCGVFDCPLDKFKEAVSGIEVADLQKECSVQKPQPSGHVDNVVGVAVLAAIEILLVIILVAVCCMYYRLRNSKMSYRPVPTDFDEM